MVVTGEEGFFILEKSVVHDGGADVVYGPYDKTLVVDRSEHFGGDFVGLKR